MKPLRHTKAGNIYHKASSEYQGQYPFRDLTTSMILSSRTTLLTFLSQVVLACIYVSVGVYNYRFLVNSKYWSCLEVGFLVLRPQTLAST